MNKTFLGDQDLISVIFGNIWQADKKFLEGEWEEAEENMERERWLKGSTFITHAPSVIKWKTRVITSLLERLFETLWLFLLCLLGRKNSRVWEYWKHEKQDENQEASSNFVSLWAYYLSNGFLPISSNSCFSVIFHLSLRAQREQEIRKGDYTMPLTKKWDIKL